MLQALNILGKQIYIKKNNKDFIFSSQKCESQAYKIKVTKVKVSFDEKRAIFQ